MSEIDAKTSVEEILDSCPKALSVFNAFGLEVYVCGQPVWETIEDLCQKKNADINALILELKKTCS